MKKQRHTNLIIRSILALALALAIWLPVQSRSAEPVEGKNMTEAEIMERCQEMTEQRQKMMAEMKAQDADLTAQVAEMNSAPADKKLDLVAAVVTAMVAQRVDMHVRMEKMQGEMMQHILQHIQMGKESISGCPMMKGMGGKWGDVHKQHQQGKQ